MNAIGPVRCPGFSRSVRAVYLTVTTSWFPARTIYQWVCTRRPMALQTFAVAMMRLARAGLIERSHRSYGEYRLAQP